MSQHILLDSIKISKEQLNTYLIPHIFQMLKAIQETSLSKYHESIDDLSTTQQDSYFVEYIEYLKKNYIKKIGKLTDKQYQDNINLLENKDEINSLLQNIFTKYARINLVSNGFSHRVKLNNEDIIVPQLIDIFKDIYVELGRILKDECFLFDVSISKIQMDRNDYKIKKRIKNCIDNVLYKHVIKNDLKTFNTIIKNVHNDMNVAKGTSTIPLTEKNISKYAKHISQPKDDKKNNDDVDKEIEIKF